MSVNQQGVSLIEILIAMTLSLFIGLSVFAFYFHLITNAGFQQGLTRILQNAQIIRYTLQHALSKTGALGCFAADAHHLIYGQEGLVLPIQADTWVTEQYNRLVVQGIQGNVHKLVSDMASTQSPIVVERGDTSINQDDLLVISDCERADVLSASSVLHSDETRTIYHTQDPLSKAYQAHAQVGVWMASEYSLSDSSYKNKQGRTIKGLFVRDLATGRSEELVQGVEDWRLLYAIDGNHDGIIEQHQAGDQVTDWSHVRGVIVHLLLTSVDDVLKTPSDYYFLGERYQANDRLLRKELDIYIALRNRHL